MREIDWGIVITYMAKKSVRNLEKCIEKENEGKDLRFDINKKRKNEDL